MKEYKSVPLHIKAVEDRTVTTLFSVFGNVDSYSDRMMSGSFQRTFAERGHKILHLWQHSFDQPPIARVDPTSLREVGRDALPPDVLRDFPDAQGGALATSTFLDTPRGNEVLTAIKAGVPLEASFGFDIVPGRIRIVDEGGQQIREIYEVKLFELSTVLWGANSATTASKMPLAIALRHLQTILDEVKAGKRHSDTDQQLIEQIASLSLDLGATTIQRCAADTDEPKTAQPLPQAATDPEPEDVPVPANTPSLADLEAKLAYLQFVTIPRSISA